MNPRCAFQHRPGLSHGRHEGKRAEGEATAKQLLAKSHSVIVPDLRGAGDSAKPESGYDKKNMAVDIHELVTLLGVKRASIVGHDIGLMVAYAYAAQFPQETDRLVLMDAFLPASNVRGKIIFGSGHWLMDEAPQTTIPALTGFLNESQAAASITKVRTT